MPEESYKPQAFRALLELRDRILGGAYLPGERLLETKLAEQLGMSRTPIREAMNQLAQEGLLARKPSGGFIVRGFTMEQVVDAIELRGVLEGTAARLAAQRGVASGQMRHVNDIVVALGEALLPNSADMDFDLYVDLNAEFHRLLAGIAGSDVIEREIARVTGLPFASPSAFLRKQADIPVFRDSMAVAQEQHVAIVEAIVLREGDRAEHLAREHARLARRNLEYVMGQDQGVINQIPGLALVR